MTQSAKEAFDISNNIFDKNINDDRIISLSISTKDIIINNFNIIDALEKLELVKSRGEAKRIIKANGVKVNDNTYKEIDYSLNFYTDNKQIKISVGKKKIGLIKLI